MIKIIIDVFKTVNIFKGLSETLFMVSVATFFAYLFGLPLGIIIALTEEDGLIPRPYLNRLLGWFVNMTRSINKPP